MTHPHKVATVARGAVVRLLALGLVTTCCLEIWSLAAPIALAQTPSPATSATSSPTPSIAQARAVPLPTPDDGDTGQAGPAPALRTLRGKTPIDQTNDSEVHRQSKDRRPIDREFTHQPPLIPHSVRGYNVTANFNKCMDCHAWSRAAETGATKVSITHFKDRDGRDLSNVSPRRYFCTQCHVPQSEDAPLVGNTFKPAAGFK